MHKAAIYVAIFVPAFLSLSLAVLLPYVLSGKEGRAAEERAHARRLADARMNARLLRFNL
jgi:hypothetical protein